MIVDILHIEDGIPIARRTEGIIRQIGLTYRAVRFLDELKEYLTKGDYARNFLIDGNFPRRNAEAPEFLFPEAVRLIRAADSSSRIMLLSLLNDEDATIIAKQYNTGFINKSDFVRPEVIKTILDY